MELPPIPLLAAPDVAAIPVAVMPHRVGPIALCAAAAIAAPMRMLAAARCAAAMPVTSCSLTSLAHPVAASHLHRLGAETFTHVHVGRPHGCHLACLFAT
jgi:hypothetical protein